MKMKMTFHYEIDEKSGTCKIQNDPQDMTILLFYAQVMGPQGAKIVTEIFRQTAMISSYVHARFHDDVCDCGQSFVTDEMKQLYEDDKFQFETATHQAPETKQ